MYAPLHVHSMYSILDGLSKPRDIARRCVKVGARACAITDHGSVAGVIQFTKALKSVCANCGYEKENHFEAFTKACKEFKPADIKPILGCELYISEDDATIQAKENRSRTHMVVLAKNLEGWKSLSRIVSQSNRPDYFYYKPRIDIDHLAEHAKGGNLIAFSGHPGSHLSEILFSDLRGAYNADTPSDARMFLKDNWRKEASQLAIRLQDVFGKGNFYIEKQRIDQVRLAMAGVTADCLDIVAADTGIPKLATPDAHYPDREDVELQQILLCNNLHTSLSQVRSRVAAGEDVLLGGFFKSNNYHIPSFQDMDSIHTKDELDNTLLVAEQCEVSLAKHVL